jgi:endonuclease/exonuclease/phosphatase family metal-dependent hydrolase
MPRRPPPRRSFLVRLLGGLTVLLSLLTLAGYLMSYTHRPDHWLTGFYLMALPLGMVSLVLLSLYWFVRAPRHSILPLLVVALGWPFWKRTVAFHTETPPPPRTLHVLSYNVYFFDIDRYQYKQRRDNAHRLIDYAVNFDADVKCFQEFYNRDGVKALAAFQTIRRLREKGYRHYASTNVNITDERGLVGLATFSRYPIVRKQAKLFSRESSTNGYVLTDLRLPTGDTVRVINVHLESTGIRVGRVLRGDNLREARTETRSILSALKRGFDLRTEQVDEIEQLIRTSPHPVIVSGDFNEVPYGIPYGRIRRRLRNAFEDAGRGLGFTLNRSPRFVRIDNQFYDDRRLRVHSFQTHRTIPYSDHYPISASYGWKK